VGKTDPVSEGLSCHNQVRRWDLCLGWISWVLGIYAVDVRNGEEKTWFQS
jgi:hypothetical protein